MPVRHDRHPAQLQEGAASEVHAGLCRHPAPLQVGAARVGAASEMRTRPDRYLPELSPLKCPAGTIGIPPKCKKIEAPF